MESRKHRASASCEPGGHDSRRRAIGPSRVVQREVRALVQVVDSAAGEPGAACNNHIELLKDSSAGADGSRRVTNHSDTKWCQPEVLSKNARRDRVRNAPAGRSDF